MSQVLLFGGTKEGRVLVEYLRNKHINTCVCVALDYREELLLEDQYITVIEKRLTEEEIGHLLKQNNYEMVIDCTHPYSIAISGNIKRACEKYMVEYIRIISEDDDSAPIGIWVNSMEEAVNYLMNTVGNILITTGSNELKKFTKLKHFALRCYPRIVSTLTVMEKCIKLGFLESNLICMQGPFIKDLNVALLKRTNASYLVTKQRSSSGSFEDKILAAKETNVIPIIIGRSKEIVGLTIQQAKEALNQKYPLEEDNEIILLEIEKGDEITLALEGIGKGNEKIHTREGIEKGNEKALTYESIEAQNLSQSYPGSDKIRYSLRDLAVTYLSLYGRTGHPFPIDNSNRKEVDILDKETIESIAIQSISNEQDINLDNIDENNTNPVITYGIPDDMFIRGKTPMTKSEVRSVTLSKLQLKQDSILYDVGAGTGTVSIEGAMIAKGGMVYAIVNKEEVVTLIEENKKKFKVQNLEIRKGKASKVFDMLPKPTHAFIDGSSGNLKDIISKLLSKNKDIRIVIHVIALEHLAEVVYFIKDLHVDDLEITHVTIAKWEKVNNYHMMMGQNPVYVISFGGSNN